MVAEHMTTIDGFNVPECALYAPQSGVVYVSNIESKPSFVLLVRSPLATRQFFVAGRLQECLS